MEKQAEEKVLSEFTAMGRIERTLNKLPDANTRTRVVNWLVQKIRHENPVPSPSLGAMQPAQAAPNGQALS